YFDARNRYCVLRQEPALRSQLSYSQPNFTACIPVGLETGRRTMGFSRSKIVVAAIIATVATATPTIAGSYGNDDEDGYGRGSSLGRMMRERMMEDRTMDPRGCPGWMMRRHFHGYGYGPGMWGGGYRQRGWMMRRFSGETGPGMMYGYGGEDESEMNLT